MTLRSIGMAGTMMFLSFGLAAQSLKTATADARLGKVDQAIADLKDVPKNAETQALLCGLYASVDQRDAAISACEAAAAASPANSDNALFLARAYGDKADHAGALTGMRLVGKVRGNFERAVELDGKSVEALSDLGQFYVDAPGVAGGGTGKARDIVYRLQPLSPARAHRLAAMITAKTKDDATAEREYQAELAVAHSPEAYVDLANFYRSRKQWDKAAASAVAAIEHDTHHGPDTLDAAVILVDLKREQKVVESGLRAYLTTPQTGVARYARGYFVLGQTFDAAGDRVSARREYAAALSLSHDYEPAQKALVR